MVVFGSKSSSVKTKLFEQPLDKLLSPKTVKQLNEAIKKNKQNQEVKCRRLKNGQQIYHDHNNNREKEEEQEEDEQCRQLMLKVLPLPIKLLLSELYSRGPSTVGIFRKSPNAKHCKELRQKLESPDGHSSIEQFQVNVIASVFKVLSFMNENEAEFIYGVLGLNKWKRQTFNAFEIEWLRSLPDCLLMSRLYPQWIDIAKLIEPLHLNKLKRQQHRDLAIDSENGTNMESLGLHHGTNDVRFHTMLSMSQFELNERHSECLRIVRQLLDALNETNLILLRAIICVLWHIANNSEHNMMCSNNLGVCIGQSLLNDEHQQKKNRRSSSLGLCSSIQSSHNLNTSPSSTSSALKHFSSSTFAKRHRRTRSQCLLASTLSLTNLSSHLSSSPFNNSTNNLKQQQVNNYSSNYLNSNDAQEAAKYVPILVAFMIDNAKTLFGSHVVHLFGPRPNDEQQESHNQCSSSEAASSQSINDENSNNQPALVADGSLASLSACNKIDTNNDNTPICQPMEGVMSGPTDTLLTNQQNADPTKHNGLSNLTIPPSSGSNLMNNSPAHDLMVKRHRRNMSTSVITVQIGSAIRAEDDILTSSTPATCERSDINTSQRQRDSPTSADRTSNILSPTDGMTEAGAATTSILIVNAPKKQQHMHKSAATRESSCESGTISNIYNESQSQSVSPSCGSSSSGSSNCNSSGCSLDGNHQQRPLSATESTTSSSRASSSTSGVHSESPAFSSEPDSHHAHRTPTTCYPHQSISVSISSPDPSSSSNPSTCTSPIDNMDTVDGSHHQNVIDFDSVDVARHRRLMENNQDEVGDNRGSSSKPDGANNGSMISDYKRDSATLSRLRLSSDEPFASRDGERPNSVVKLNGEIAFNRINSTNSSHEDKQNKQQSLDQHQRQEQQQFHSREYANFVTEQNKENSYHHSHLQSQTLNRYTSSNSQQHIAMFNRMPKIPFQYTTSCYGGEAVLYYPSHAHLSQQHHQQQSFQAHRGCNRIQSLDRLTTAQYNQQHSCGQQQLPQRSHVMMLRDYYLSLQEQSQEQQAFISQRQRAISNPANNQNYLQRAQNQKRIQHLQRQHSTSQQSIAGAQILQQQHSLQSLELSRQLQPTDKYPSYTNGLQSQGSNSRFATTNEIHLHHHQQLQQQQQPTNVAIAYQRNRPRLAKIRPNQFNGLYVKRASSPHLVTDSPEGCNNGGLIVRPLSKLEMVVNGKALQPTSNGTCAASLMAISQSSLSQQSSKMSSASDSTEQSADDDESDDCSTGEWMESTMV